LESSIDEKTGTNIDMEKSLLSATSFPIAKNILGQLNNQEMIESMVGLGKDKSCLRSGKNLTDELALSGLVDKTSEASSAFESQFSSAPFSASSYLPTSLPDSVNLVSKPASDPASVDDTPLYPETDIAPPFNPVPDPVSAPSPDVPALFYIQFEPRSSPSLSPVLIHSSASISSPTSFPDHTCVSVSLTPVSSAIPDLETLSTFSVSMCPATSVVSDLVTKDSLSATTVNESASLSSPSEYSDSTSASLQTVVESTCETLGPTPNLTIVETLSPVPASNTVSPLSSTADVTPYMNTGSAASISTGLDTSAVLLKNTDLYKITLTAPAETLSTFNSTSSNTVHGSPDKTPATAFVTIHSTTSKTGTLPTVMDITLKKDSETILDTVSASLPVAPPSTVCYTVPVLSSEKIIDASFEIEETKELTADGTSTLKVSDLVLDPAQELVTADAGDSTHNPVGNTYNTYSEPGINTFHETYTTSALGEVHSTDPQTDPETVFDATFATVSTGALTDVPETVANTFHGTTTKACTDTAPEKLPSTDSQIFTNAATNKAPDVGLTTILKDKEVLVSSDSSILNHAFQSSDKKELKENLNEEFVTCDEFLTREESEEEKSRSQNEDSPSPRGDGCSESESQSGPSTLRRRSTKNSQKNKKKRRSKIYSF